MEYYLKSGPVKKDRYTIGFLDDNQDNEFHNQIMAGIAEAAQESDVDIIRFSYYSSHIAYKFSHQIAYSNTNWTDSCSSAGPKPEQCIIMMIL